MQLGNARIPVEEETVIQLVEIIDDFYTVYMERYSEIFFKFSWDKFKRMNKLKHELKLCEITKSLWFDIMSFYEKYDYNRGNSEWHIFDSTGNMIKIYDKKIADFRAFILPRIEEPIFLSTVEENVSLL